MANPSEPSAWALAEASNRLGFKPYDQLASGNEDRLTVWLCALGLDAARALGKSEAVELSKTKEVKP